MRSLYLLIILTITLLSGCATFTPHSELPAGGQITKLTVSDEVPGMNDYPIGAYVVPNSQIVITKPRTISTLEGGFGALGVLSAHSSGKKDSQALVAGHEESLSMMLSKDVRVAIEGVIPDFEKAQHWTFTGSDKGAKLELTPYVHLSPDETGESRVYLFLKVKYYDEKGASSWNSRYIYCHPKTYPIIGDGSWTADNARLFKQVIDEGYQQIAKVMIKDSSRSAAGWSPRPVRIKAPFFAELNGEILEETTDSIVFNAEGGGIFYGINILPRNQVEILPRK